MPKSNSDNMTIYYRGLAYSKLKHKPIEFYNGPSYQEAKAIAERLDRRGHHELIEVETVSVTKTLTLGRLARRTEIEGPSRR